MAILAWIVVVFLAAMAGAGLTSRLRVSTIDGLGLLVYGAALGLGVGATAQFAVGFHHGIAPFALPVLVCVAAVWSLHTPAHLLPRLGAWLRALRGRRPDVVTIALTFFVAAMAILTVTGALAPPISNEWDALAYHLAVPKVWLHDGRIHALPYDSHSGFPMLTEMLYGLGLAWKSVVAAKLFHWLYGMLTALACYWAGRRWVSRKAGLLAAALFLACPVVAWEATTAYIDLASALYTSLSVFALLCWRERGEGEGDGWLILCALMAGFACGTKMTMVATTGLVVLWAAGLSLTDRNVSWKHAGLLAGIAALIGGPWYLKTWLWTGNPVYPFAYSLFGGKWWSAQAALDYAAEQARFGIGKTAFGFLMAPWATVFHAQYYANPPAVFDGTLKDAAQTSVFPAVFGNLGLGALAFAPLWLLRPFRKDDRPAPLNAMLTYCAAFFLVWFALTHQTRYFVPILPLLLVPASAGARAFWHAGKGWRASVGLLGALSLVFGVAPAAFYVASQAPVAWGLESQDTYLRRMEPIYSVSQSINQQLPPNAKVLFLQETRGFYIDRTYQWGNPSQNALLPWRALKTPAEMNAALRAQGITHVLVNWSATTPATNAERWPALAQQAIARGYWEPVIILGKGGYTGLVVYALSPRR